MEGWKAVYHGLFSGAELRLFTYIEWQMQMREQ